MNILAIDSTAVSASAALSRDGKTLAVFSADNSLTHSEILLPMAEAVLKQTSQTLADVDLFACTAGPGSFTGVRIGVATVKGLAFGTGKPCAPVSTLEALAENLCPLPGILCPVMDARRGQVYNALFTCTPDGLTRLTPDRALSLDELADNLLHEYPGVPVTLAGDGYGISHAALTRAGVTSLTDTPVALRLQDAAAVARCALRMYQAGKTVSDTDLVPIYLRLPQAERDRVADAR